jgi:tetratricopeptide (TPR) repeat protein
MTTVEHLERGSGHLEKGTAAAEASDWQLAATELRTGLQADPDAAPRWYFLLGHVLEKTRDLPGSAAAFDTAIRRNRKAPAWWHYRYAGVLGLLKDWEQAAESYETAIARRGSQLTSAWFFRLGLAYEHLGRWDEVGEAYRRGLSLDPEAGEVEWRMLEREVREFPGRRSQLHFVQRHLSEIQDEAARSLAREEDRSSVIYSYWGQGYDAAPEIVRRCHQRLLERSSLPVLTLDEPAMSRLVQLPDAIEARGIAPTHRTDLIRLELLARYGGTWLDATCLVTEDPAPSLLRLRRPSGYFTFAKRKSTLATWLMTSTPDHQLVRTLRAALHSYWLHHDRLKQYFTLHYIFEALTELDREFGACWQATPRVQFDDALGLRWQFGQPYEPESFQQLLDASFVHKLTYKYEPAEAAEHTMLAHLLETI